MGLNNKLHFVHYSHVRAKHVPSNKLATLVLGDVERHLTETTLVGTQDEILATVQDMVELVQELAFKKVHEGAVLSEDPAELSYTWKLFWKEHRKNLVILYRSEIAPPHSLVRAITAPPLLSSEPSNVNAICALTCAVGYVKDWQTHYVVNPLADVDFNAADNVIV